MKVVPLHFYTLILTCKTNWFPTNMQNNHHLFTLHIRLRYTTISTFSRLLRLACTFRWDRFGYNRSCFNRTNFFSQLQRTQRIPAQSNTNTICTHNLAL